MLTRRLITSASNSSPSHLIRSFSTSASHQRSPALADITPNNASAFETKQREFREKSREQARAKKEQDSQSHRGGVTASSPAAAARASSGWSGGEGAYTSASSTVSKAVSTAADEVGLGKLSTHSTVGRERESSSQNEASKRGGKLSNLIYGTKEGREMDQDIEKSFSQVLARGKYVHSIVFHTVKPDKVNEYVELVGKWYPRMTGIEENHVHLVGSWRTEVGDCDTFGAFPTFPLHPC